VTLDGPDAQSFSAKGCQGATLAPGSSCLIAVSFDTKTQSRGDGKGNYAAGLTITDDAGNSPQTVQLTAFYPPPAVTISPSTLKFPPDSVTVSNTSSGADLTVTNVAITGTSAADFTVASNTCDTSIHAGSSCTIQVRFSFRGNAPACSASTDATYCAQLIISDNAGQGQQRVDLQTFVIG
jgi:hypothetical protein